MGKDLLHWSQILLNLSKKGLEKRDILNKSGDNETKFLKHLQKLIDSGIEINSIKVASHSFDNNFFTMQPITAFAQTSPKAKVMRITDEDGKSIVVTPDHKVFTKNRGYVMAKDLTETDELMILSIYQYTK